MDSHTLYDLKSVKLPVLSGAALRAFVNAVEGPLGRLLIPNLLHSAGISALRRRDFDEAPTYLPLHFTDTPAAPTSTTPSSTWPQATTHGPGFPFAGVFDYADGYRNGVISPEEVAQQVLDAIAAGNAGEPPLRAIIKVQQDEVMRMAAESAQRHRQGRALSPLDGVPVAIKDELDMTPYPTGVGTSFLGSAPAAEDATAVARLRAAGALLIGKANMHEIGLGVTGLNPHHGTPRNPYNPAHYPGGSSGGSAAAVAAGLCPVAVGADGGGSIRIPAAFCGVVGLKPTFGRISEFGAFPLDWSVAHIGPIGGNVADVALAYAIMAGPDPKDANSLHQPAPTLAGWDDMDIQGLRIGVFWPWFRHAAAEVVTACEGLLKRFEAKGAQIREVVIPDLEAARLAHVVTISGEMAQAMDRYHTQHHTAYGLDVRMSMVVARAFSLRDYVKAQRVRTRLIAHFQRAFETVDLIVTPSTGMAAPPISATALNGGDSDLSQLAEIIRFASPANLTGLPAISFPAGYTTAGYTTAGYTTAGLPIGMQAIARPWDEVTLLRLAGVAESIVERRAPQVHHRAVKRNA